MKQLANVNVILYDKVLANSSVTFDKKITAIGTQAPDGTEIIDGKGLTVWPGFIDVHTHGIGGMDTMDGGDTVKKMAQMMTGFGTTSFLATTVTASREDVKTALESVKNAIGAPNAANVLGAHVEGPFICEKYKGAHDPVYLTDPDFSFFDGFESVVKLVTVAPELDGSEDFIKKCASKGIRCSIGHTAASFDLCKRALGWGAVSFTHSYNAMTPLTHREPGAVGACMALDGWAELICDNIHISPVAQAILSKQKKDKILLITDALRVAGWGQAEFTLGTLHGFVRDGAARLDDGTLAGSMLTMNLAAKNYGENTGLPVFEVARATSWHQAQMLGIDNAKGKTEIGYDADFAVLNADYGVEMTIVSGEIVYKK